MVIITISAPSDNALVVVPTTVGTPSFTFNSVSMAVPTVLNVDFVSLMKYHISE